MKAHRRHQRGAPFPAWADPGPHVPARAGRCACAATATRAPCPSRLRRAGEHGFWFLALGWEGIKLGALIIIPATLVLAGAGAWGAATYNQQHSRDPLSISANAPPPPPNLNITDYAPAGPHRDCHIRIAGDRGLSWSDSSGWTASDPPRPTGADASDYQKVNIYRGKIIALLRTAEADWTQTCDKPELGPAPERTPQPEQLSISGTYDIASGNINECGVSEAGNVTSLVVSQSGDQVTISFPGSKRKLTGPISSDYGFKASYQDPSGGGVDIDGHFGGGTGGDVFLRDGNVSVSTSGSGLVAHPCSASFEAKKPGS